MSDGHGPVSAEYVKEMNALAKVIDEMFNGDTKPKQTCFVLLTAPFNTSEGRVNYIANGDRQDVIVMLKELLARFEGQAEVTGRA